MGICVSSNGDCAIYEGEATVSPVADICIFIMVKNRYHNLLLANPMTIERAVDVKLYGESFVMTAIFFLQKP